MSLTEIDSEHAYSETGVIYHKNADGEWEVGVLPKERLNAVLQKEDQFFVDDLMKRVPNALLENGDQIYIRKFEGRLQWIKANVHGGGQEWQELTPWVGKSPRDIEVEAVLAAQKRINAEAKVGWYQSLKGELYERGESGWIGKVPGVSVEELEYLG